TSSTRPTWARSTSGRKPSTFLRSTDAISAASIVSSAIMFSALRGRSGHGSLLGGIPASWTFASQRLLQLVETVTDGAVDHGVADRGNESAHEGRVDHHADLDVLLRRPTERGRKPLYLRVVERNR